MRSIKVPSVLVLFLVLCSHDATIRAEQGAGKETVEGLKARIKTLEADIDKLRSVSDKQQQHGTGTTDCDCAEFEQSSISLQHYMTQFQKCKLSKQSMKVLNWFLAKEVHGLNTITDDLKQSLSDQQASPLRFPDDELDATCQEQLAQAIEASSENATKLEKCLQSKQIIAAQLKKAQQQVEEKDVRETLLNKKGDILGPMYEEAVKESQKFRKYFLACIIALNALVMYNLKGFIEDYIKSSREREAKEKKLRKEARAKGRKAKTS